MATGLATEKGARFPKQVRLRTPSEYKQVFARGQRLRGPHFMIVWSPNALDFPRLGLALAKKQIPLAAQRNRIRRALREQFRLQRDTLGGYDLVFVAQAALRDASATVLRDAIRSAWSRLSSRCAR